MGDQVQPGAIPTIAGHVPAHVAIIMDGNGRWAQAQGKPRHAGHKAGQVSVRSTIESCIRHGIGVLTLYAFSSENWRRPQKEVSLLMELFMTALQREVKHMRKNNIQLRVIGDISAFPERLQKRIHAAEQETANNTALVLQIAANYGGRWDIAQAARQLASKVANGEMRPDDIDEQAMAAHVCGGDLPDPDLFIRTGGDVRVSNFLLWQSAYAEMLFTPTLWPDFDAEAFESALAVFAKRQRRFGQTGEQVTGEPIKE